jgi:hypothetical protein
LKAHARYGKQFTTKTVQNILKNSVPIPVEHQNIVVPARFLSDEPLEPKYRRGISAPVPNETPSITHGKTLADFMEK